MTDTAARLTTLPVLGLSGGKDSTALALRLREVEPGVDFEYICTPTGDELPPMIAHWKRLEEILEKPLIRITHHDRTLDDLIQIHDAVPNFRMRWCTRQLKIEPTIAWCVRNAPVLMHVGLRADEETREGIYGDHVKSRFPFREWGWGIEEVLAYLRVCKERYGITIPKRTDCGKCYHQRISEWKDLWQDYPDRFFAAAEQERRIGHTFRSPGRDTWPVALFDLAAEFQRGRPLRQTPKHADEDLCRACSL